MLTVKDLLKGLEGLDPDLEVVIKVDSAREHADIFVKTKERTNFTMQGMYLIPEVKNG